MKGPVVLVLALACTVAKPADDVLRPQSVVPPAPSCEGSPACGVDAASCCESMRVPPGVFAMGFSAREAPGLAAADREHDVQVSGFYLDRFEVTWARYAAYAEHFSGPPAEGAGAHPALPGSGWRDDPSWNRELPERGELLIARARGLDEPPRDAGAGADSSLIASVERQASFAAEGLSWFAAFAFCIWDGGRLPTEAEWEYAASSGFRNTPFPWGDDASRVESLRNSKALPVGSLSELRGPLGHDDLAGGVLEWTYDWFSETFYVEGGARCVDCANLEEGLARVVRGGADESCCGGDLDTEFRAASRNFRAPGVDAAGVGARCARDLPSASGR